MEARKLDIFISHAAEDKVTVARPLAGSLRRAGSRVWLDEQELTVGDSLSEKIDEGLTHSTFGAVIVSIHGGLTATRRHVPVVEVLVQAEHACGSCPMIPGRLAGGVTWSRGCGL
jgi:hypothetical protein